MSQAAAVLFASAALAAGVAVASPDAAGALSLRLLVKHVHPLAAPTRADQAEIARQATEAAGLPVAYGASVSADWSALRLTCEPAECDAAVQRLRDAKALFAHVERDERRRPN